MTDLRELAERVEALEGPSREVDLLLCALVCPGDKDMRRMAERGSWSPTGSIDKAISLVPEGCVWLRLDPTTMTVSIPGKGEKDWARHVDAKGATPALALVAAALRAIASQKEMG